MNPAKNISPHSKFSSTSLINSQSLYSFSISSPSTSINKWLECYNQFPFEYPYNQRPYNRSLSINSKRRCVIPDWKTAETAAVLFLNN